MIDIGEHLRALLAEALGCERMTAGQITYELRRLRLHGIITRLPGTFRYRLTEQGLQTAVAYTPAHDRVQRAGMAQLADSTVPGELRRAYDRFAAHASRPER